MKDFHSKVMDVSSIKVETPVEQSHHNSTKEKEELVSPKFEIAGEKSLRESPNAAPFETELKAAVSRDSPAQVETGLKSGEKVDEVSLSALFLSCCSACNFC